MWSFIWWWGCNDIYNIGTTFRLTNLDIIKKISYILNKEVENSTTPEEARELASKRIKEIREKYMDEIRDLRSKITIARKYA